MFATAKWNCLVKRCLIYSRKGVRVSVTWSSSIHSFLWCIYARSFNTGDHLDWMFRAVFILIINYFFKKNRINIFTSFLPSLLALPVILVLYIIYFKFSNFQKKISNYFFFLRIVHKFFSNIFLKDFFVCQGSIFFQRFFQIKFQKIFCDSRIKFFLCQSQTN